MRAFHARTGLAAIPYTSQANGMFNRLAKGGPEAISPGMRQVYHLPENARRFERLQALIQQTGRSVTQVVLGYLLSQPFATVPIVGCRNLAQLDDSLSAAGVRFSPLQLAFLEGGS